MRIVYCTLFAFAGNHGRGASVAIQRKRAHQSGIAGGRQRFVVGVGDGGRGEQWKRRRAVDGPFVESVADDDGRRPIGDSNGGEQQWHGNSGPVQCGRPSAVQDRQVVQEFAAVQAHFGEFGGYGHNLLSDKCSKRARDDLQIDDQICLLINSWCELLLFSCCYRSIDTPGEVRISLGKSISLAQAKANGLQVRLFVFA